MTYTVFTQPVSTPVSLALAKAHLKVDDTSENDAITAMIQAATNMAEQYLNSALMPQTIKEYYDCFPAGRCPLLLHRVPVTAVTELKYFTDVAVSDTLTENTDYLADLITKPARLEPVSAWPATIAQVNAVQITYTAGYADESKVPGPIKAAILLTVGDLFENREDRPKKLPSASEYLLRPYRVVVY